VVPIRTRPVSSQPNYQTKSSKPMNSTQSQTSYKKFLCLRQAPTPTIDTNNRHSYDGGGRDDNNNDQRPTNSEQRQTTNDKRQTTNDKRQTTNDKRQTTNDKRQTTMPTTTTPTTTPNCHSHLSPSHPLTHTHTPYFLIPHIYVPGTPSPYSKYCQFRYNIMTRKTQYKDRRSCMYRLL